MIKTCLLLLLVFNFSLHASSTKGMNVLFIAIDDMNDWVGCLGGHPNAITPNIDKLAARGMLFKNGHIAAPVCNPSRAAFLSGIGPWRSGIYHNGDSCSASPLLNQADFLPAHFQKEGYLTMMGGKIFHGGAPEGKNDIHENAGLFGGQSFRTIAHDFKHPFKDLNGIHNFAVHWGGLDDQQTKELSDPKTAKWASERLKQTYDQPFMLMVGFHRPHTPLTSPKKFWDMFDREEIELPIIHEHDLDDMPWLGRQVAIAGYQAMEKGHYKNITERGHHRDIAKAYLAACAFVDAQVGKVINALDKSPHKDNTIVVLFSDHGWGVGERFHFKKWGLWDDTTHIPYIVHVPGMTQSGSQTQAGVDLLDLYPTLVDLTGVSKPCQKLDGKSLRPLLENPNSYWERPALTTFGQNNYALRTPIWRYIRWSNGSEELYDHRNDAHEWYNVADRPEFKKIKQNLSKWFPHESVMSVSSDFTSPVRLSNKKKSIFFRTIHDKFVDKTITVKAKIGPKVSDGVILRHGGQFSGYSLYVKDNKLHFSKMDVPRPLSWDTLAPMKTIIFAPKELSQNKSYQIIAELNDHGKMILKVNGEVVAEKTVSPLSIHPAGPMILGASKSRFNYVPIGDYNHPFDYKGDIDYAEVYFGK